MLEYALAREGHAPDVSREEVEAAFRRLARRTLKDVHGVPTEALRVIYEAAPQAFVKTLRHTMASMVLAHSGLGRQNCELGTTTLIGMGVNWVVSQQGHETSCNTYLGDVQVSAGQVWPGSGQICSVFHRNWPEFCQIGWFDRCWPDSRPI